MKLVYKDAEIDVNAGLTGFHGVTLRCAGKVATFEPNEMSALVQLLYPAIAAWAGEPLAPSAPASPGGCVSPGS